jgi:RNA ligase (TIGR02306 family)
MTTHKISSIKKVIANSERYDIEVKDNHNYFASGILVHNCNASYGWYRKEYVGKNPILGLIHRFWGPKFYVRSHKAFKDPDSNNNWTEVASRLDLASKLRPYPGIAIYGEVFGAKVQDLTYYQYGKTLRVFDVYDLNKRRWFDYDEAAEFCQKVGLEMVPVLYKGPYLGLEAHAPMAEGLTTIQPPEGVSSPCIREGWVIKPLKNRSDNKLGRVIMKFVGQTYLLRHGGTEKH